MNSRARKKRQRPQEGGSTVAQRRAPTGSGQARQTSSGHPGDESWFASREAIESIVVAIILALLFRAFEAEAFVIPTGSMAPTLLGRHRDLECSECGYLFPTGDSVEQAVPDFYGGVCPLCGFVKPADASQPNERPFTGDRILVNKFAYQFWEPERWDVIVFKNPGNPKQNYIKRLVGLPNETIRIYCGDIYVRSSDSEPFQIARKPPAKLRRLLRLVHDTQHVPQTLVESNWPTAWQSALDSDAEPWKVSDDHSTYALAATEQASWLHYVHTIPDPHDWTKDGQLAPGAHPRPQLITDSSGYNVRARGNGVLTIERSDGYHWTGDLAVQCDVKVDGEQGTLFLQLIEAGGKYTCEIDVKSGQAVLRVPDDETFAAGEGGEPGTTLSGQTDIKGAGTHSLLFANVDDQLLLWVDDDLVAFQHADGNEHDGGYETTAGGRPQWSPDEPGDLHPVRIAAKGVSVALSHLQVYRDMYYIAADEHPNHDYKGVGGELYDQWKQVISNPRSWSSADLFGRRRDVVYTMGADQFFPLGDNSAVSQDARLWDRVASVDYPVPNSVLQVEPWVERERLIGKAFLVYWPHAWRVGFLPILPNFSRMKTIR